MLVTTAVVTFSVVVVLVRVRPVPLLVSRNSEGVDRTGRLLDNSFATLFILYIGGISLVVDNELCVIFSVFAELSMLTSFAMAYSVGSINAGIYISSEEKVEAI